MIAAISVTSCNNLTLQVLEIDMISAPGVFWRGSVNCLHFLYYWRSKAPCMGVTAARLTIMLNGRIRR